MTDNPLARIGEEHKTLEQFHALLQQEQALLVKADVDALFPLIEEKNRLADLLSEYSRFRESVLEMLKLPPGRDGVTAWLKQKGTAADQGSWQSFIELASETKSINQNNGKLIALHIQHNQQAFNALMAAANRPITYGPDGQQQRIGASRILGTA